MRDVPPFYREWGWTSPEYAVWARDHGHSVHASPDKATLLGMENFGNSCYANSVLQALYHCEAFRTAVLEPSNSELLAAKGRSDTTMLNALTRLFHDMSLSASRLALNGNGATMQRPIMTRRGRTPSIVLKNVNQSTIKMFLSTLQHNAPMFDSRLHHDAHEFLNVLLNLVGEDLQRQSHTSDSATYMHRLFEGVLTNETRCLSCEAISNRDEQFLDLPIEALPHTSVTAGLRHFSKSEMLSGRNKFFCDQCSSLQEAEKRMKIKSPPEILALHLKRFKWDEKVQAYVKPACRVTFPLDLRLFNTTGQGSAADPLYRLFAIVIHVGAGTQQGHYISLIKIGEQWALFDDELVQFVPESDIAKYYGDAPDVGSAYVLFYHAVRSAAQPASAAPTMHTIPTNTPMAASSSLPLSPTATVPAASMTPVAAAPVRDDYATPGPSALSPVAVPEPAPAPSMVRPPPVAHGPPLPSSLPLSPPLPVPVPTAGAPLPPDATLQAPAHAGAPRDPPAQSTPLPPFTPGALQTRPAPVLVSLPASPSRPVAMADDGAPRSAPLPEPETLTDARSPSASSPMDAAAAGPGEPVRRKMGMFRGRTVSMYQSSEPSAVAASAPPTADSDVQPGAPESLSLPQAAPAVAAPFSIRHLGRASKEDAPRKSWMGRSKLGRMLS